MTTVTSNNPNYRTPPAIIAAILGVSVVASLFLVWLVYYHPPIDAAGAHLAFLPALDAVLNALCAIFLLNGFRHIRARQITPHRNSMFFVYLWLLLTPHILLAVVALPMILITFFLSLTGRFPAHRRLARWTFPIWLYVSVSGVVVYAMLASYR